MKVNKKLVFPGILFLLFLVFTLLVRTVNVKPIGPEGSTVGFAGLNAFFLSRLSYSKFWYTLAEIMGLVSLAVIGVFGLTGLWQLIQRRSLRKVDPGILLLGCFYILVLVFYFFFDKIAINYRPVILEDGLEASYPSSHTVLALCVMGTALSRLPSVPFYRDAWMRFARPAAIAVAVLTVLCRLLSGAHWFTDILGGLLLSAALLMLYRAADEMLLGRPGKHEKRGT